jgi:hypothetical protein
LNRHAPQLVDQIVRVQFVAYFVCLHLALEIALAELEDHLTHFVLVLFLVVVNLFEEEEMNHHTSAASREENVLPVRLQFLLGPLLKASPVGCFNLVVRLIDSFAVDDPVDSIDELFNVKGRWVSLLEVAVVVVFVLTAEGIDISPYDIF